MIRTTELLGQVTVPLILLIIGYGISFDRTGVSNALQIAALRLALLIQAAYLIGRFVFRGWWGLDPMFQDALFTIVVLPPPFIVPLYMAPEDEANKLYANNILAAYTVISVVVFSAYIALRAATG